MCFEVVELKDCLSQLIYIHIDKYLVTIFVKL